MHDFGPRIVPNPNKSYMRGLYDLWTCFILRPVLHVWAPLAAIPDWISPETIGRRE